MDTTAPLSATAAATAGRADGAAADRLLFMRIPQPCWVFDAMTLRFLAVNEAAVLHYGYSEAEFLAMQVTDIRPAEDVPELPEKLRSVAAPSDARHIGRHRRRDGSLIDVELSWTHLSYDGRDARLVVANDLTGYGRALGALRATEQRLAQREHLLRAVADGVPGMVGYWTAELRCGFANAAYFEWFGRTPEQMLGIRMQDMMGEALFAKNEPFVRGALDGRPQHFERTVVKPDGTTGYTQAHYMPDVVDGVVRGFFVQVLDITEMHELQRDARILKEVVEAAEFVPISICDATAADLPVRYVNAAFERLTGYPREEIIGRNLRLLQRDRRAQPGVREMHEAIAARRACRVEVENFRRDGTPFVSEVHLAPVFDGAGQLTNYIGVQIDLTERRRSEALQHEVDTARRDREAAEQAARTRNAFLGRLSHELRTPLNAVIGFSDLLLLQPGGLATAQVEPVEHIRTAGRHLLALVDDVLNLQAIEQGRLALRREPLDLKRELGAVLALLAPLAQRQRIALQDDVADGIIVDVDARYFRQVLMNVGSNAIRFNRAAGTVRFSAERIDEGVRLSVEDTGRGIATSDQVRVFEAFERVGRSTDATEGSGLGLLIARGLMEQMGGGLTLDSEAGAGTRVIITVPGHAGDGAT